MINDKCLALYTKECQVGELKEKLLEGFSIYHKHVQVKRVMHTIFEKDKLDSNYMLLQVGFEMACSCEYQNEIQSTSDQLDLWTFLQLLSTMQKEKNSIFLLLPTCLMKGKIVFVPSCLNLLMKWLLKMKENLLYIQTGHQVNSRINSLMENFCSYFHST